MHLLYRNFKGMLPRLDSHLKSGEHAELALDVNLWHGTLRPFREKALCRAIQETTKSIYYDDCCWKEFDKCVEFTRLNTNCKRQVVTGLFSYPATACSDECNPTWIRLGLPCPGVGPEVERLDPLKELVPFSENFIDSIDYARVSRTYVYTYVNSCCDEGPPSYPSEVIDVDDGGRVMLSGFNTPSAEYDVTSIRIYRLASGFDATNTDINAFMIEEKNTLSEYFLVGEIPIGETVFVDDLMDYELGVGLETQEYTEPPSDLRNIISFEGTQLVGTSGGNKIRFSMPNYPHVWQEGYELTLPDTIQALVEYNHKIIALTCGGIYEISPMADCKTVGCRQVTKTIENYPLVSCCGGQHGYTVTPRGVVFVSTEGLILTDGQSATNITSMYFAPDDWKAMHPDRISVAYHRDSIYFFSDKVAYVLQFPVSVAQWENSLLIALSDRPRWAFSENEQLYLVEEDGVYRWDMGLTYRPYLWRGKKEISPTQVNFAGAKVSRYNTGDVEFKLTGDDILIKEHQVLKTEKFRLPSGRRDVEFQLELSGTAEVYQVEISTSYRDLGTV